MKHSIVKEKMTSHPYIADRKMTADAAELFMQEHNIRHLPVIEGGQIVGIVDDHVLRLANTFSGPGSLLIEDVMDPHPYCAPTGSSISSVAKTLAQTKRSSAIILDDRNQVVGIFTVTDALNILADVVDKQQRQEPSEIPYDSFPEYMSW